MAVFSLKIAPKHDTRNRYPPISTVTAEMGGFSIIGGTMPRMSKKRKKDSSTESKNFFRFGYLFPVGKILFLYTVYLFF